jgi:hypothetical protein
MTSPAGDAVVSPDGTWPDEPVDPSGEPSQGWFDPWKNFIQGGVTRLVDELLWAVDAPWMTEDVYDLMSRVYGNTGTVYAQIASWLALFRQAALWTEPAVSPADAGWPAETPAAYDTPSELARSVDAVLADYIAPTAHATAHWHRIVASALLASGVVGSDYVRRRRKQLRDP